MSDDVECPHCGRVNDSTDFTENWRYDGDTFTVSCSEGEEDINLKSCVEVSYEIIDQHSSCKSYWLRNVSL